MMGTYEKIPESLETPGEHRWLTRQAAKRRLKDVGLISMHTIRFVLCLAGSAFVVSFDVALSSELSLTVLDGSFGQYTILAAMALAGTVLHMDSHRNPDSVTALALRRWTPRLGLAVIVATCILLSATIMQSLFGTNVFQDGDDLVTSTFSTLERWLNTAVGSIVHPIGRAAYGVAAGAALACSIFALLEFFRWAWQSGWTIHAAVSRRKIEGPARRENRELRKAYRAISASYNGEIAETTNERCRQAARDLYVAAERVRIGLEREQAKRRQRYQLVDAQDPAQRSVYEDVDATFFEAVDLFVMESRYDAILSAMKQETVE